MSIKIKHILLAIIICAIITTTFIVGIENQSDEYECETVEESTEVVKTEKELANNPTKDELKVSANETEPDKINEEIDKIDNSETKETENSKPDKPKTTEISEEELKRSVVENFDGYGNYDVPSNNTIKSYMDYRCITMTGSRQYKLQHSLAYTGDKGIRMVNGRYCVAVGSYYTTKIGQYIDIELANGNVIEGILADCKADSDTDSTNRIHPDGSVVEFVVDTKSLDRTAKLMGDISYVNGWNSKIVNIKVYDKVENF